MDNLSSLGIWHLKYKKVKVIRWFSCQHLVLLHECECIQDDLEGNYVCVSHTIGIIAILVNNSTNLSHVSRN